MNKPITKKFIKYKNPNWDNALLLEPHQSIDDFIEEESEREFITCQDIELTEEEFENLMEWEG